MRELIWNKFKQFISLFYYKKYELLDSSLWNQNRRIELTYLFNRVIRREIIEVPVNFQKNLEVNAGEYRHKSLLTKHRDVI
jgi:hypothetical protein